MNLEAIASLTTAGGTLVLAIATFGATSSANRASRSAERSLLAGLRRVLTQARLDDPDQKIGFTDEHWVHPLGARARTAAGRSGPPSAGALPVADSRHLCRARRRRLLAGRVPGPVRPRVRRLRPRRPGPGPGPITVDLLHSDLHGGQRTVTRFSIVPVGEDGWFSTVARHWMIDNLSPR